MKNDAMHPYTYHRSKYPFVVLRHGEIKQTMIKVSFAGMGDCTLWVNDEDVSNLIEMLSDCLETSKPLFTEVA